MRSSVKRALFAGCALPLLGGALAACGLAPAAGASSVGPSAIHYIVTRCGGQGAVPSTTEAPPAAGPAVYAGTVGASLRAFAPEDGTTRGCVQFAPAQTFSCPPTVSCPPPPLVLVGKPLVAGGVLYTCVSGRGGYTYAFDAADGALRWARQTDCMVGSIPFADYATPVLAEGTLYAGVCALDPRDGTVRWRLPDGMAPGAAAGGMLYSYTQDAVSAWTARDGERVWSYALPDPIGSVPAVANGVVYVGDIGGDSPPAVRPDQPDTFALDARTGKLLWRAPTGIASGSPVVVGATVYVGGFGPALFALEAATGHIRWRRDTGPASLSTPVVADGVVYFTADGLYAVDAATGALRWRRALGASRASWFTDPALAHGALYVGWTDGRGRSTLYALGASDGAVRWQRDGLNQITPPVAAG